MSVENSPQFTEDIKSDEDVYHSATLANLEEKIVTAAMKKNSAQGREQYTVAIREYDAAVKERDEYLKNNPNNIEHLQQEYEYCEFLLKKASTSQEFEYAMRKKERVEKLIDQYKSAKS